jgi:hypothetical protein
MVTLAGLQATRPRRERAEPSPRPPLAL